MSAPGRDRERGRRRARRRGRRAAADPAARVGAAAAVKPAPFLYERPDDASRRRVALLREHGDEAKVLAGGQCLVPLLNLRLSRPAVLVDINRVAGLDRATKAARSARPCASATSRGRSRSSPLALPLRRPLRDAQPRHGRRLDRARRRERGAAALPASCSAATVRTSPGPRARGARSSSSRTTRRCSSPTSSCVETDVAGRAGAVGFAEFALAPRRLRARGVRLLARVADGASCSARSASARSSTGRPLLDLELDGAPATPETAREAGARAAALVDPPGNLHASAAYLST